MPADLVCSLCCVQVLLARQRDAAKARTDAMDVIGQLRTLVNHLVDKHPQLALQGGLQVRRHTRT